MSTKRRSACWHESRSANWWNGIAVIFLAAVGICAEAPVAAEPIVLHPANACACAASDDAGQGYFEGLGNCHGEPLWRARANVIWLRPSKSNDAELVTDFTPGGASLLNATEFSSDSEIGPEVAIWRKIDDNWSVEGRFFRVDGWNGSRGVVNSVESDIQYANPFRIGVPSPDPFILDTTIAGTYRSQLTNVEVNGRRRINDFWSLLLGFRYLSLSERLTIDQGVNFGFATFTHDIRAVNDLYGFQAGGDMRLWSRGRLSIEGLFKAGVYGNCAANRTHVSLTNSTYSLDSSAADSQAAFLGEMGVTGVYRLTDCLSVRGGYQYLWLAGLAQASDQVAVSNPLDGAATVSFAGNPSYHGAFVGVEFAR